MADDRTDVRRTQAQRRETMVALLIEATVDAIDELGYASASIQQVVTRAGVSQGALFRHFPTRLDLVAATAQQVLERQVDAFEESAGALDERADARSILTAVRDLAGSRNAGVVREIVMAARSDILLRQKLAPHIEAHYRRLGEIADTLPMLAMLPCPTRRAVVTLVTVVFDGEAVRDAVLPDAETADAEFEILIMLTLALGVGAAPVVGGP
ncbi:TetR/AcrR family transcriptional regulator [Tsukamurella soli]